MKFDRPEFDFEPSLERGRQAQVLFDEGRSYSLSMDSAGVGVECMLRAFKMRKDSTFDEKHNLLKLFAASGMLEFESDSVRRMGVGQADSRGQFFSLHMTVSEVHQLWSNDLRFASEARARASLKNRKLDRGIRGDPLKEIARRLIVSASRLIDQGVIQWNLRKKSDRS